MNQQMYVIGFPIKFDEIGLKVGAYDPEDPMQFVQSVPIENALPVPRDKYQMGMQVENHMPSSIKFRLFS